MSAIADSQATFIYGVQRTYPMYVAYVLTLHLQLLS